MIKVKREGRDGVYIISPEELIKKINALTIKRFHSFKGNPPLMIGADWDKEDILNHIINGKEIYIGLLDESTRGVNFGHSITIITKINGGWNRILFDMPIKDDELEIINDQP